MDKIEVNGKNTHSIYKFLRANSSLNVYKEKKLVKEIPWNFAKFLVSGDGKKIEFFNPRVDPKKIAPHIEKYLNEK